MISPLFYIIAGSLGIVLVALLIALSIQAVFMAKLLIEIRERKTANERFMENCDNYFRESEQVRSQQEQDYLAKQALDFFKLNYKTPSRGKYFK